MIQEKCPPNRVLKFQQCHDTVWLWQNGQTGEIKERGNHCNDRFCQVCGRDRSRRIARALSERIAKTAPLFITLTVRGSVGAKLKDQLQVLQAGWRALRRMPIWKAVKGGAAMIEVKWSTTGGGHWHPHIHIVAEGRYMEQSDLSRAWAVCTGGSTSVNIKRAFVTDKVINYVAKYASKPMDGSFTDKVHKIREAIAALGGVRLCACFGTWFGTPLNDGDSNDDDLLIEGWICVGSESNIRIAAASGCAASIKFLEHLDRHRAAERLRPDG